MPAFPLPWTPSQRKCRLPTDTSGRLRKRPRKAVLPSLADMNKDIKHTGGYGWQGDFEASMSDDGSWSASVSYVAPPGEKFTPSYSLHCHVPGFTDLTLSGYQHSRMADLWKTSCTFKKDAPQEDEDPDDPEPGDPDTWNFDPKDTKTTWEFTAGVASKSIFDHPDFKSMFQDNPDLKKAYEAIMSGRVDIESLKIDSRLKRKDPYDFGLGGVKYSQELSDLFNKIINKGITDYYTRSCSYSITTTEGKGPDAALQSLISAGGGNFVKMGEDKNTYGRNMETTQSFSQILEEGILIIGS